MLPVRLGRSSRLFDQSFGIDDVRQAVVTLLLTGTDNFRMEGASSMGEISRDPEALAEATLSSAHQYPDGRVPHVRHHVCATDLRDGEGFTHKLDDVVEIATPTLGRLANKVTTTDQAPPWTFGVRELMRSLAARGLG